MQDFLTFDVEKEREMRRVLSASEEVRREYILGKPARGVPLDALGFKFESEAQKVRIQEKRDKLELGKLPREKERYYTATFLAGKTEPLNELEIAELIDKNVRQCIDRAAELAGVAATSAMRRLSAMAEAPFDEVRKAVQYKGAEDIQSVVDHAKRSKAVLNPEYRGLILGVDND